MGMLSQFLGMAAPSSMAMAAHVEDLQEGSNELSQVLISMARNSEVWSAVHQAA